MRHEPALKLGHQRGAAVEVGGQPAGGAAQLADVAIAVDGQAVPGRDDLVEHPGVAAEVVSVRLAITAMVIRVAARRM